MMFITICPIWVCNARVANCNSWFRAYNSIPFQVCTICLEEKDTSQWTSTRMSPWIVGVVAGLTYTLTWYSRIRVLSTGSYLSGGSISSKLPSEAISTLLLSESYQIWSLGRSTCKVVSSESTLKISSSQLKSFFKTHILNINRTTPTPW